MMELPVDFRFSSRESSHMQRELMRISDNPYRYYSLFDAAVDSIISRGDVPDAFVEFCENRREVDTHEKPYVILRNCPIDINLPLLDYIDPVSDKRARKLTYVAEGFLLLYAKLMQQEPIGYANVKDGDI